MENMRNKLNYAFLSLFLVYIFTYRLLVYPKLLEYSESITSVFLIVVFCISVILYGFKNVIYNDYKKNVLKKVLSSIGIYFLIIYMLGLILGFLSNSYSLSLNSIFNNIFFQIIIITMLELIRSNFINYNKKDAKLVAILTIIIALFEINISYKTENTASLEAIFKFTTTVVLPISFRNYMCSYLTYYTDFEASLIYSIILGIYKFIVPVEPDIDDLLLAIINILLPFSVVMAISRYNYNYEATSENVFSKKYVTKSDIPFLGILIVLILLIFGIGPYKIIGIKSGSMSPKIRVGDAVFVYKNVKKENLKENDIVVYESIDKEIVVHRIIKINDDGSYITKGDYNNTVDSKYIKFKQIKGIVKFKIPYIAYPAVYFDRR